jgi:hypothetical protein
MATPFPSVANVGNVLTAQAILFDSELIPNLKGQTNAFVAPSQRRVQPLKSGINRAFFQYLTLGASLASAGDGVVNAPEFVGQITAPAVLGEWNNYSNFSAFSVAAAIDELVGNSAIELGYQAGQTISELYSATLDSAQAIDNNVDASGLLSSPFLLDLNTIRTMKQELVSINVMPCKNGKYCGQISPNVAGDIFNAVAGSTTQAIVDILKYTKEGQAKFDELAGSDQMKELELPGTNVVFYQTPFVHTISNYQSGGLKAYRTYVEGLYSHIGVWLEVPGDTELGDGSWNTIECKLVSDAPSSVSDPVATIGAWCGYRFHQTVTLPPAVGLNTQRIRFIDSVPKIQ